MNKLAELRKKDIYQSNPFLEMQKSFKDVLELRIFFLAQTDVRPHLPGVKDEGRWDFARFVCQRRKSWSFSQQTEQHEKICTSV